MKLLRTWVFCFSILSCIQWANGQEDKMIDATVLDSLNKTQKIPISLRFGVDLSRIIKTQATPDFRGFETVADLRIRENFFIAMELGNEEVTQQSERINFTTQGTYYKLGFDLNMYENWEGMDNHVLIGVRFASSSHSQNLNSYQLLDLTPFWQNPELVIDSGFSTGSRESLNAFWLEFLVGFKVQIVQNVYLGLSLRLNRLISDTIPENFENIYIPGFNKKTEDNKFGAGFNYTLTYRIPFRFKK